ncbi:MAG TPA: pyridoxine 5'-phosphate synthase [Planctomycetota bacterium]|nr:pyridoxine 5'-phosphate synthase [Planctomycetota bacterium]
MPQLYVNLDHVATLRQVRGTPYPSVLEAALLAEKSGFVDGITLHLREDRRHVQDQDMRLIGQHLGLPFNFEMSSAEEIVALALELSPEEATIVPERREELTTEGGLNLLGPQLYLRKVIDLLADGGTRVSLFIDPDESSVARAKDLGASHVELHTGAYANAQTPAERDHELGLLQRAAEKARSIGLIVNAGHGLTVENVGPVARIPGIADLNIGHAIVARSIFVGLPAALEEMARAIRSGAETR